MCKMSNLQLPKDCAQQWEILLPLLSLERNNIAGPCDSEVEIMFYFYNNDGIRKILQEWLLQMHSTYAKTTTDVDTATKSDEVALYWREQGNKSFHNNAIDGSYSCYMKSVLFAVPSGPMYPLALANRSAALLRLKRYEDCLADIKLALKYGYPESQRHKLYLRQADCFAELQQVEEATAALDRAKSQAEGQKLPCGVTKDFECCLKLIQSKLQLPDEVSSQRAPPPPAPPLHHAESRAFANASDLLELRCNATAGRHVVTREATKRGDVLFAEEPYAFVVLPPSSAEEIAAVCEACCRPHINAVPCTTCSRAVYCGEECRDRAWTTHHRWECVGAQMRLFRTVGVAHLALRVLLMAANEGLPPLPEPAPAPTAAAILAAYAQHDRVQVYRADAPPFLRMFHLVTNFDKMDKDDYVQYALTATMLTLYLEMFTSFLADFRSRLPCPLPAMEARLLAGALVLRAMGQLVCNAHTARAEDIAGSCQKRTECATSVATAIYPSAAMMNHSCDPNIAHTFYGSRLIVRCERPLVAGAEVLNCYGPRLARHPAAERRKLLLAQYHFHCSCDACTAGD